MNNREKHKNMMAEIMEEKKYEMHEIHKTTHAS